MSTKSTPQESNTPNTPNTPNFLPLNGNILIKRDELKETNSSGLFMNHKSTSMSIIGTVLLSDDESVHINTKVMFANTAGTQISLDQETFTIIKVEDIIGVIG